MLWSLVIFACQPSASVPLPDPGPPAAERVEALSEELTVALALWRAARYPEAQQTVQGAYADHFEPLEPALSADDPAGTLALEYAFGRLVWQLRRGGNTSEVSDAVTALTASVTEAVADAGLTKEQAGAGR